MGRLKVVERDDLGKPTRVAGTITDAEDQHRRQAQALDEARLLGLSTRINEAELLIGPDSVIVEANDRAFELYGRGRAELVGQPLRVVRAPDSLPDVETVVQNASVGGHRYETEHRRKDGSTFRVEVSSRLLMVGGVNYLHALVRDLTEPRRQDAERRLLAEMLACMQDTVVLIDRELKVVRFANPERPALGWYEAEVVGKTPDEVMAMEYPDGDGELHRRRLTAGAASRARVVITSKDGQRVDCDVLVSPRRDDSGRLLGFVSVIRDISQLMTAERTLAANERRLRSIFTVMGEGLVLHDASGAIVSCNASAEGILGLTRDQLEGRTSIDPRWRAVHHDGSPFPGAQHPAMVTLRTGQAQRNVVMGVHKPDGALTWISVSSEALRLEPDAAPYAVVASFTDITALRQRELDLEVASGRLASALEGSNDGHWGYDLVSGQVFFSARWEAMFGYRPNELEPCVATWERMVHPDDRDRSWADLRRHIAGEIEQHVVETRLRHKDGRWLWVLTRGKVVARTPDGAPTRLAGTTDITDRKLAEEQLAQSLAHNLALVAELKEAALKVKTLSGLIPICMHCKKIRDDAGFWERIEKYISEHSNALFSHGVCPACFAAHYGDQQGED